MTEIHGVFEGGGIRGLALAGAASAVMDEGYTFDRVAGTSAGALVASLIAAGYTAAEFREAVADTIWPRLLDHTPGAGLPVLGRHIAFLRFHGIYRGAELERVWRDLLARKGVKYFGDLPEGKLRMISVDLTHETGVVLPDGLADYGVDPMAFSIAHAVRMSSAVPFIFQPVKLRHRRTGHVSLLADGALGSKFPVELVSQLGDHPVFGFRPVDVSPDHAHNDIRGPASLAAAVMKTGMSARETLPRGRFTQVTQILVPTERQSMDFDLTARQAVGMFDRGYEAGMAALDELKKTGAKTGDG